MTKKKTTFPTIFWVGFSWFSVQFVVTNLVFQNSKRSTLMFADFQCFCGETSPQGCLYFHFCSLFQNQFLNVNECSFFAFSGLLISTLICIPFSFFPGECASLTDYSGQMSNSFRLSFSCPTVDSVCPHFFFILKHCYCSYFLSFYLMVT